MPHLIPINRGILETIYVRYKKEPKLPGGGQKLIELYKKFYKQEPFVRVKEEGACVRLKEVVNTNFCDIAINTFVENNLIIITTAIDNLSKGAAGQAVQNMNIMYGFPEQTALI